MNQVRYLLLVVTVVAIVGVSALALNVPHTFVAGEVISAAEMNENFAAVETAVTALESTGPGIASAVLNSHPELVAVGVVQTIRSVTIEAPAAGYVWVNASFNLNTRHVTGTATHAAATISASEADFYTSAPYVRIAELPADAPSAPTLVYGFPTSVSQLGDR